MKKEDIFKKIFLENYHLCCIYGNRYIYDIEIVKDIVQEVFFDFWIQMDNLDLSFSVTPLLYKYTKNRSIDYIRTLANKTTYNIESITLENLVNKLLVEDQLKEMNAKELDKIVETCVESLPLQCRKVFLMSRNENLKNKEIAQELGISVKTVEKHITKALSAIRKRVEEEGFMVFSQFIFISIIIEFLS